MVVYCAPHNLQLIKLGWNLCIKNFSVSPNSVLPTLSYLLTKVYLSTPYPISMKESVVDDPPRRIAGLEFGALSPADILKQSEVEVSSRVLYDITKGRIPMEHGPLDTKLVCFLHHFLHNFIGF